jgi:hypothetical protein
MKECRWRHLTRSRFDGQMTFDASNTNTNGVEIDSGYLRCMFTLSVITMGKSVDGDGQSPQGTTLCIISAKGKTSGNPGRSFNPYFQCLVRLT